MASFERAELASNARLLLPGCCLLGCRGPLFRRAAGSGCSVIINSVPFCCCCCCCQTCAEGTMSELFLLSLAK